MTDEELFEELHRIPPFTIRFKQGHDAHFLMFAVLVIGCGGDMKQAKAILDEMVRNLAKVPPIKQVEAFIQTCDEFHREMPDFVKPFMLHILTHWRRVYELELERDSNKRKGL